MELKYLQIYAKQMNNGCEAHIRELASRALMAQIWNIGERKFKSSYDSIESLNTL